MILSTLQQWYKNFRAVMAMPITAVPLPLLRRKKSARARRLQSSFPAGTVATVLFVAAFGLMMSGNLDHNRSVADVGYEGVTVPLEKETILLADGLEPAAGEMTTPAEPTTPAYRYAADDISTLDVEAVLVPQKVTVISSSRDGRIADVLVQNGDVFAKGDVLLKYDCDDLEAEASIASLEKTLLAKKAEGSDRLFKLDVISDLDRLGILSESEKASAREKLYKARLDHCTIRAGFDGRVTNRLANPGEYTRTDRVLMEVASREPLQAEFLVPSKWLRWIDVGAPLNITITETGNTYEAEIIRIYGEVDPVSQSIQVVARLKDYNDRLLPGMSGQAMLDIDAIRGAGVSGFLEQAQAQTP